MFFNLKHLFLEPFFWSFSWSRACFLSLFFSYLLVFFYKFPPLYLFYNSLSTDPTHVLHDADASPLLEAGPREGAGPAAAPMRAQPGLHGRQVAGVDSVEPGREAGQQVLAHTHLFA